MTTFAQLIDRDSKVQSISKMRLQRETVRLKGSLLSFVQGGWSIVEPERPFSYNWHIGELCQVLEDVTYTHEIATALYGRATAEKLVGRAIQEIQRVIINVPPGTMKSLLVSVFWPCWMWARNPKLRILTATYSDKRALDANLKARNIIQSPWFQTYFPIKLTDDSNTKGRFDTAEGGWRIATSVGGEGTGLHPDFIIIDDASTALDAQSDTERKAVSDWFSNTVSTRGVSRDVAIVVIGQRLHEDDLSGFLLNGPGKDSWVAVVWPMRFEPTRPPNDKDKGWIADPRDHRKVMGELLWPELYPEHKVKQLEIDLAEDAPGQLQQNPSPKGGRLFKVEHLQFFEQPPALLRRVRGWDTGGTEGGGDPTAGVLIGEEIVEKVENGKRSMIASGRFYVLDVTKAQLGPEGVDKLIVSTAKIDGTDVAIREQREGGSSGKAVTGARAKSLKGYDYEEVLIGANKVQFSKPFRAQVNAGNVYLPKGAAWVRDFVRELQDFPTGRHDDQVDAAATSFNAVLLTEIEVSEECTW